MRFLLRAAVLRRNLTIALVVGVVLSIVNQMEPIASGELSRGVLIKIVFNFVVPFTVASVSSAVNRPKPRDTGR